MSPSEALRELGRANAEVEKLTGYLIVSLQAMQDAQTKGDPEAPWTDWLALAYEITRDDGDRDTGHEPCKYHTNHDGDVAAYLHQHCQYALNAHLVIQTRKEARKRRAIARRRITLMARNLAKEPSP